MTSQQTCPENPVTLPLDGWLYEAKPKDGCPECSALAEKLGQAVKAGDATARFEAARQIRAHPHHTEE